jgi:hypothetical protein
MFFLAFVACCVGSGLYDELVTASNESSQLGECVCVCGGGWVGVCVEGGCVCVGGWVCVGGGEVGVCVGVCV